MSEKDLNNFTEDPMDFFKNNEEFSIQSDLRFELVDILKVFCKNGCFEEIY